MEPLNLYLKGFVVDVPFWVLILEAAKGDPLKAQELEEGLTKDWWMKYRAYGKAVTRIVKAKEKKLKSG